MLKIVVYDLGWGGELVADYLETELQMVEVVRVNAGNKRPKNRIKVSGTTDVLSELETDFDLTKDELYCDATTALAEYLGKVDLIVLGGYTVSELFGRLCREYPEQHFTKLDIDIRHILHSRSEPRQVAILMNRMDTGSSLCQTIRLSLPAATLLLPDCAAWEKLIDEDLMDFETLYHTFALDFVLRDNVMQHRPLVKTLQAGIGLEDPPASRHQYRPDTILLLSTHFWAVKTEIERLFGYTARVIDFREKLLHDVCRTLELRGVDGRCRYD